MGKIWTVIDRPFADTKVSIAGFSPWKKGPTGTGDVEIRPLFSMEDFEAWEDRQ
jgi:hypothetical protein